MTQATLSRDVEGTVTVQADQFSTLGTADFAVRWAAPV